MSTKSAAKTIRTTTGTSSTPANAAMAVVRKGRAPVDPNETKEQKLARLANKRVTAACRYIRLVGNLAAYKPSEAQVRKMMIALGESCAAVENRFMGTRQESIVFRLE
jgi:hypothetical protein